jgi:exonuclease VII small subunit
MRREIQALREKLDEMETHVRKIESENIELKRLLNK